MISCLGMSRQISSSRNPFGQDSLYLRVTKIVRDSNDPGQDRPRPGTPNEMVEIMRNGVVPADLLQ
jgi:hypothetical protein